MFIYFIRLDCFISSVTVFIITIIEVNKYLTKTTAVITITVELNISFTIHLYSILKIMKKNYENSYEYLILSLLDFAKQGKVKN